MVIERDLNSQSAILFSLDQLGGFDKTAMNNTVRIQGNADFSARNGSNLAIFQEKLSSF